MLRDGLSLPANSTLVNDLAAYYISGGGTAAFAQYALENYDATQDYWRLTGEGDLEYDGFATLRDENGEILISNTKMGLSNMAVESALLYILGIDPKDDDKVAAVRNLMIDSGLVHSSDADPSNWYWNGEHDVVPGIGTISSSNSKDLVSKSEYRIWTEGSSGERRIVTGISMEPEKKDLTMLNMGKIISLESIAGLYNETGVGGNVVSRFVDTTYKSPVDFLNYADTGGRTNLAVDLVSKYLDSTQLQMVQVNQQLLNNIFENPQDITKTMFTGAVSQTQPFGVTSEPILLKREEDTDPFSLIEDHPAIDVAGAGETITTPGGYWTYNGTNGYNAIFSLYGGDLKMRINHVNTDIITYERGGIIGAADGPTQLLNYPDKLYGTGSGTHVHVEYTLNLPYNGVYTRQYVNPNTLLPHPDYLDYTLYYYDKEGKEIRRTQYNRLF
jgi:hypothetical protein